MELSPQLLQEATELLPARFKVDEHSVRLWRKQKDELEKMEKQGTRCRLEGGGRKVVSEELEESLVQYVVDLRRKRLRVTHKMLRREAKRRFQDLLADKPELEETDFKASRGWCYDFCERNAFTIRMRTTVAQNAPVQYGEKIVNFLVFVRQLRNKSQYELNRILNCDETPVWFENVGSRTLEKVGAREVTLKTTGHEKLRCTVMLTGKLTAQSASHL